MSKHFAVVPGFVRYFSDGHDVKEIFCEGNPWCYDKEEEARIKFDEIAAGLALTYRDESQLEERACVELQAWYEDADGRVVRVEVLS